MKRPVRVPRGDAGAREDCWKGYGIPQSVMSRGGGEQGEVRREDRRSDDGRGERIPVGNVRVGGDGSVEFRGSSVSLDVIGASGDRSWSHVGCGRVNGDDDDESGVGRVDICGNGAGF